MPAHCCFKWLINSDMALKVKDVKDSKIIKLVVLIMGGGEHRFASRYKKKVLQIYEGPFSIVAEARLELTTFGL